MPFQIIQDDITRLRCDAIVNAANSTLLGGGGVDGAIHAAAGPKLKQACARLGGCPAGRAKITKGYDLPCRYVIHTVGPIWEGGDRNEEEYLRSCYRESLALALEYDCETVAFPLISGGSFGYPKEEALQIAIDEISHFLMHHEMYITLVIHKKGSFHVSRTLLENVLSYIDDVLIEPHCTGGSATVLSVPEADHGPQPQAPEEERARSPLKYSMPRRRENAALPTLCFGAGQVRAHELVFELDESFSEMLLRKIDEKGMTDAECYKKANIDRKLFSKIRKDPQYKPSKSTAIAFAVALELPLPEAQELLKKAGFALSRSNKFDVIIEYFIQNRNYNIFEINEVLFAFDQSLLGA